MTPRGAKIVLGTEQRGYSRTDGIELHFSKPVYAETLQPGVVDLWRVQAGKGLAGVISQIEGSYVDKPDSGLVDSFKFRDDSGETLNRGDRVLIQVRANFILDACCRPVDGEHVGGLVPQLAAYKDAVEAKCLPTASALRGSAAALDLGQRPAGRDVRELVLHRVAVGETYE